MVVGELFRAGFGNALQKQVKSPSLILFPTLHSCTRRMPGSTHPDSAHHSSHTSKVERTNTCYEILGLLVSSSAQHYGAFVI